MTDKEIIANIKAKGKFPRTFDDYMNYAFLFFPNAFIVLGFSMIYNYFKFHSSLTILFFSILYISGGTAFDFFILKRLRDNITFTLVSPITKEGIDSVANRLEQKFDLRRIEINKDLDSIIAFTKATAFSWGEQLTLVFDKDRILINSRPSGSRQPITILKDRQNIKKLKQIVSVIDNI
jgi:hypothetical protein